MAYSDFSIDRVAQDFNLQIRNGAVLDRVGAVSPPAWLPDTLRRGRDLAFVSEISRREFLIAPVLLACRELLNNEVYFYSGIAFDVDADKKLTGACDYLFSWTPPTPVLQAPFLLVTEAKKNLLDYGLGQCAAQMVAARIFNERRHKTVSRVFGCVTTGETWQLLMLQGNELLQHNENFYIHDVGQILWVLTEVSKQGIAEASGFAA